MGGAALRCNERRLHGLISHRDPRQTRFTGLIILRQPGLRDFPHGRELRLRLLRKICIMVQPSLTLRLSRVRPARLGREMRKDLQLQGVGAAVISWKIDGDASG